MRITTGGSVGIGTDDPTAQYDKTIHIEGENPTFRAETTYSAGWAYNQYVSPETTWSVGIDNNDKYIIANSATLNSNVKFVIDDANGNVGIGTTTPVSALHVIGDGGDAVQVDDGYLRVRTTSNNGALQLNSSVSNEARIAAGKPDVSQAHPLKIAGDYVRFCTSGAGADTEVARFTADGKVGIGTTDPDAFLDVSRDNSNAGNQFVVADTEGVSAGIRTYTVSDPQGIILNHYYAEAGSSNEYARYADIVSNISNGAGSKIRFITKNAANTYSTTIIDNEGRVGIGTTDPSHPLHVRKSVNGNFAARLTNTESTAGSNYGVMVDGGTNSSDTSFEVRNSNLGDTYFKIRGDGKVGVGTTAPSTKLHVSAGSLTMTSGSVLMTNGYPITWGTGLASKIYAGDGIQDMVFTAGSTEAMRINGNSQNIGIGTNAPSKKLTVSGDIQLDGDNQQIFFGHANTFVGELSNSQKLQLRGGGSNSTHTAVLDSAGRFGLATSAPQVRLHLENSDGTDEFLRFSDSAAGNVGAVRAYQQYYLGNNTTRVGYFGFTTDETFDMATTTSNGKIRFLAGANQEAVRITSAGNVGIGSSSPSYELDVNGTTRSTFYIGGAYLEENASSSKLKFYTDGTVLVMDEDGELKPCEKENDTLVFGVTKRDFDSPVVLGAEPVLVTGPIKVGDYIVTSSKQGHGQAMKEQNIGTIIAQAMESGDGESYNIKAMIRKM
jgi:hypothetical protein